MFLEDLPAELFVMITDYLSDGDKLILISCCKNLYNRRYILRFDTQMFLRRVIKYDPRINFTNISIDFRKDFDDKMAVLLPRFVKRLVIGDFFNHRLKIPLPATVRHLKFGAYFNHILNDNIPDSVTHLIFGTNFNQCLIFEDDDGAIHSCLPKYLTHLTFGYAFNQPLIKSMPSTLTHLTFGFRFNQPVELNFFFPEGLTHLAFGACFNQPVNSCIPTTVTHLAFHRLFNQRLDFLHTNIQELTVDYNNYHYVDSIPLNVQRITYV